VLGSDFAGRVEAVGADVKRFHPGDEVFGSTRYGCFAECVCVSEQVVVTKPASITFEEAASVGAAASTALKGLRDAGQIQTGQRVLINGASGGLGTFAVQLAKWFGAGVTGVCSTRNLDMVRSIGADQVVDYTQEDFTQQGRRYDLVFDVVAKRSFADCRSALHPGGTYVTTEFSPGLAVAGRWASLTSDKKMVPFLAKPPDVDDLLLLSQLLEGETVTPVIDTCYDLSEVPEALRYLAKGHSRGKVVITM
jgi:NADPH:quinone reductase-like Zn-dependent oxidoreductase